MYKNDRKWFNILSIVCKGCQLVTYKIYYSVQICVNNQTTLIIFWGKNVLSIKTLLCRVFETDYVICQFCECK